MIKSASEIRSAARAALSGHWADGALLAFIYLLISWTFSRICFMRLEAIHLGVGSLASLPLLPLGWGFCIMFLLNRRGVEGSFNIGHLFDGYKDFKRIFPVLFMRELYVILWALLFAILYFVTLVPILGFVLRFDMPCTSLAIPRSVWEDDEGYPTLAGLIRLALVIIPAFIPAFIKSLSYSMTPFILYDNAEMRTKAIDLSMKMMKGHKMALFILYLTFTGWGILCIFTLGIGYIWFVPYMNASLAEFYEEVKADYGQRGRESSAYQKQPKEKER